jgi:plastocyanin
VANLTSFQRFNTMKLKLLISAGIAFAPFASSLNAATNIWTLSNFQFSPPTLTINVGDSVAFKNVSGFHSATCEEADAVCGSHPAASSPWNSTFVYNTPGTYNYRCVIHSSDFSSGMIGTLVVRPQVTAPTLSGVRIATNGAVTFNVAGTPSVPQVVEGSADFKIWTPLSTNNTTDGNFVFSEATVQPWRFYRVRE